MTTAAEDPGWPAPGEADALIPPGERAKAVFTAKVGLVSDREKGRREAEAADLAARREDAAALRGAQLDADRENLLAYSATMSTLAVGAVDRSRAAAELVQKSAAAVAGLYTGVLALVFSVTDNPLPARGVLAALFLGGAVVLSTAYVAYTGPRAGPSTVVVPDALDRAVLARLNSVITVTSELARSRVWFLRASVVALGVGLAYIALPFLDFSGGQPTGAAATSATQPAWPTPPSGANVQLDRILYMPPRWRRPPPPAVPARPRRR